MAALASFSAWLTGSKLSASAQQGFKFSCIVEALANLAPVVLKGRRLAVVAVVNKGRENRRRRLLVALGFGVGGGGGGCEGRSRLEMGALPAPICWCWFFLWQNFGVL